jgi:hypothetical protein
MTPQEIAALLARTAQGPHGTAIENYKRKETGAHGRPHRDGELA